MTKTISLKQLPREIENLNKKIAKDVDRAVRATSRLAVKPIRKRVPVAFGELRDSVHSDLSNGIKTVADAPHAAAVEVGSAPHTPDIAALIEWVKLRGYQGIRPARRAGPTTQKQAKRVAALLKREVVNNTFSPIDAAEKVAMAIAKGIEKHGTKPHWFVRESLADVEMILDAQIKKMLA